MSHLQRCDDEGPNPFVTVVIPVYAGADVIRECLDGLAMQSYDRELYEVLIVDNGDNPDIDKIVSVYPFARLLKEESPGSYAARNVGIRQAQGDILAFTDADCRPHESWLLEGVKAFTQDRRVGLVGGRVRVILEDASDDDLNAAQLYDKYMAFDQAKYVNKYHFAATANMFTTRHVVEQVGVFDQRLFSGGDLEFGVRVARHGYCLKYVEYAVVDHPARDSFGKLLRKARRLSGGKIALERVGRTRKTLREWINIVVPPVISCARVFGDKSTGAPMRSRLLVMGVIVALYFVDLSERIAIYLGKSPER